MVHKAHLFILHMIQAIYLYIATKIDAIKEGMVVVLVSSSVTLIFALVICAWFKAKVVYCLSCCDRLF
jgi:hypothetical protein